MALATCLCLLMPAHAEEAGTSAPSPSAPSADVQASAKALADLRDYLQQDPDRRDAERQSPGHLDTIADQPFASVALTREDCVLAKQTLVEAHRAQIKSSRMAEHETKQIKLGPLAKAGQVFIASHEGNHFTIERADVEQFSILVRDDMVDLDKPLTAACR